MSEIVTSLEGVAVSVDAIEQVLVAKKIATATEIEAQTLLPRSIVAQNLQALRRLIDSLPG